MTLRVASDLLPEDANDRHARLRNYFCDKDATASRDGDGWVLDLSWPEGAERHVDPRLGSELAAWGVESLSAMSRMVRRSGRVTTSLYDTWSLLSWSNWAAHRRVDPATPITILHVDDHRDLGSPRLERVDDELVDMITGRRFDVLDPASVQAACESGAVGMGSFLTPFLLAFPNSDVRHLGQSPKVSTTRDFAVHGGVAPDDLLRPDASRPTIELIPSDRPGPGGYRITDDLGDWLEGIAAGPILLHVDMDYFNNRYDGDGDWADRMRQHDPQLDNVLAQIDRLGEALRISGLLERIEDAAVAFSPGFFPAEMWRPADARLRTALAPLHG